MALFMDVHTLGGAVGMADVAQAHAADLATQERYGVDYLRYWVDEENGKIFCLVEAPDAEAAETVHREAHGLRRRRDLPGRRRRPERPDMDPMIEDQALSRLAERLDDAVGIRRAVATRGPPSQPPGGGGGPARGSRRTRTR